ncbi:cuticle protein AMP4-like [Palaemon carinicauda]|uniref:cuticle protein AMP4-like n=1 Tax=Palaemon carinicauda TaxID=392227 RepID=UPI0035B574D3
MKAIVLSCFFALALAAPQQQFEQRAPPVAIVRDDRVDQGDGNFNYAFAAENGIETEVAGAPGSVGQSNMQGFYLLPREDGSFARVNFVANENGFQPEGDTIPAIPEHVFELLRIAEEQRASGVQFDDQGFRLN